MNNSHVGLISALIYTPISVAAAGIFLLITRQGDYGWVARIGGAAWIFILCMIISMPLVTSRIKNKYS